MRGQSFDVRGATLPGSVNFLIGQSPTTVWGVTALGADQEDLFRLSIDPLDSGKYLLDGVSVPFGSPRTETIEVLGESPVVETYRETVFGPVVTPIVNDVDSGEEYAVRRADSVEFGEDSSLGFLRMYRAADIDQFGAAVEGFRIPSTNVLFGDTDGRIGYWVGGALAVRSSTQMNAALAGRVAQEGDSLSGDWVEMVPHALKPSVIDPADGFLLSANHMPIGSWYPIDIMGGSGSMGETARSVRLRELTDALPFTVDRTLMLAPHFDRVNWPQRELVRLALRAESELGVVFTADANSALREAEAWLTATTLSGQPGDKDNTHRGVVAASGLEIVLRSVQSEEMVMTYGAGESATILFLKQKQAEFAQTGTVTLEDFESTWLDGLFSKAWTDANDEFGPPQNWLDGYTTKYLSFDLPAFEVLGLPALDPLDVLTVSPLTCSDGDTLLSQGGQSSTMVAVSGEVDSTEAVLPLGQGEPGKPHESDQESLFVNLALRPAPTTKAGINALVGPATQTDLIF